MSSIQISTSSKRDLKQIATKSAEIRSELMLDSEVLTPVNFESEREKFIKSKTYSPRYIYKDQPPRRFDIEIDEIERDIEKINLPYDIAFHLIDYLNHLRFLYHARCSIGGPTFSVYAKLAYDWNISDPDKLLETLPKFEFENEEKGPLINAPEIAIQLAKTIKDRYKILDLDVNVNNFTSNIIFVNYNQINIGKDIRRFQNNVNRLVVHEVESHALQNYNMRISKNPLLLLSKLSDAILFSEGLGVYNEVKTKTITKKAFQNYYYRLKSVKNSRLSFRKIYEMLMDEKLSDKHAFNIAFRIKRGMQDTSQPGGYTKEAAYLLGYKAVLNFVKNNDESLLYYSKNPNVTKLLLKYNLLNVNNLLKPTFL